MIVYHLIIIGEERFLEEAFKDDYLNYKKSVRRYLQPHGVYEKCKTLKG